MILSIHLTISMIQTTNFSQIINFTDLMNMENLFKNQLAIYSDWEEIVVGLEDLEVEVDLMADLMVGLMVDLETITSFDFDRLSFVNR